MSEINSVFERVKAIVVDTLMLEDATRVQPESEFINDLYVDKMDFLELVVAWENEFNIQIPGDDAKKLTSVQEVVDYIIRLQ